MEVGVWEPERRCVSIAPFHSGCMRAASRLPNDTFLEAARPPQGRTPQRLPIASLSSAIQYLCGRKPLGSPRRTRQPAMRKHTQLDHVIFVPTCANVDGGFWCNGKYRKQRYGQALCK